MTISALFDTLLAARLQPSALAWLRTALVDDARLHEAFVAAGRKVGRAPLRLTDLERAALVDAGVSWSLDGWDTDGLARARLLLACDVHPDHALLDVSTAAISAIHRDGDARERAAVLRTLALLRAPARFHALAVDACRSHVQPLFEAIAAENPYPARFFDALAFNQLVLKCLFTGVALERVVELPRRTTPELLRMANDYASERRAAGRSVPTDIERLAGSAR
jgi:hypothetical protein